MKARGVELFLAKLWALEDTLIAAGFPPLPRWWREVITRFYLSGKRRLVVRKGRRVFASTCVAPRLAVAEMLFGQHLHVPGTPPLVFAFVSVKRDEAANRLRGIKAILDVLGEGYVERGETIELGTRPAIFAVLTANFRLSVGDTVAFCWCDEVARWNDEGANPAEQVVGTLAPAQATLPNAKLFLVSSPLGSTDFHARSFDLGETDLQCAAFGATWTINPSLDEAACRGLEPNEKLFLREYAGIPQADATSAFDPAAVARALGRVVNVGSYHPPIGVVDLSSGRGDACAFGVASWCTPVVDSRELVQYERGDWVPMMVSTLLDGKPIRFPSKTEGHYASKIGPDGQPVETEAWKRAHRPLLVWHVIDAVEGRFNGSISGSDLVAHIARVFRRSGVRTVIGDQREEFFARSEFMRHELQFHSLAWTNSNKTEAVTRLNRLFAEDAIALPDRPKLRRELLSYCERITPSGTVAYSGKGAHDDEVSLLITCAIAELERLVPGSTLFLPNYRTVVSGR